MDNSQNKRLEQAARWLVRSKDKDFSSEDWKMLTDWLEADPANRAAYEELGDVWEQVGAAAHTLPLSADERTAHREVPVDSHRTEKQQNVKGPFRQIFSWNMRIALAGAVMAMGILLCLPAIRSYFLERTGTFKTYTTANGEQKQVTLEDGSVLKINVGSMLSVCMNNHRRQVELGEGEVFFDVAPDPARPFEVKLPTGWIQVLGTGFNVKNRAGHVSVDVDHGRVWVKDNSVSPKEIYIDSVTLTAGQGVDIRPSGRLAERRSSDIAEVLAWQRQQVVFRNVPVGRVLDELALYHHVKINLVAIGLEERGITGTFNMQNLDRTLNIIAMAASLKIEKADDGSITLSRGTVVGDR